MRAVPLAGEEGTLVDHAVREIARELQGCPKDTTAAEVNALLLRSSGGAYWRRWHYSTYRRAVRAVQAERARILEWEGQDARKVRPHRKMRGLSGTTAA